MAISTATLASAKKVSDDNLLRAERNERLARGAVDHLGSQMAELLSDIPSAEPVRRRLLTETLHYYQQFAIEAANDPSLREDLAITYGKIGSLQRELAAHDEAIDALSASEQLFAKLAQAEPQSLRRQLDWSTSQSNLGLALEHAGRLEEATRYFTQAINRQRNLLSDATAPGISVRLAMTLNNLGLLLARVDAIADSRTAYNEALSLLDAIDDRNADAEQLRSTVLSNLGSLLAHAIPETSLEFAQQAFEAQFAALEKTPGDAKLATQVAVTLNTLGSAQSELKRYDEATVSFQRAVEIGRQLHTRWPDQLVYSRDLVISLNHLGLVQSKRKSLQEARDSFGEAIQLGRVLLQKLPHDAETLSMLGSVLNNLGFLEQQLSATTSAREHYNEAIQAQSKAVELAPEVPRYRELLRKHQENARTISMQGTAT